MSESNRRPGVYVTSYKSIDDATEGISDEGTNLYYATDYLREEVYRLADFFGNPATDEAARLFRKGQDGQPGFDEVYHDLDRALQDILTAYSEIAGTVGSMSTTVRNAEWVNKLNIAAVERLVEFSAKTDDTIPVPTTEARH